MSTPRKQWLLKVIAGPHQGAEVGMRTGKILIGSDDECDVVLHDVLIAPQHVEMEANSNGLTASPLGGRVYINGKRIRDARQPVPDFAFVSIGGSHLVLGPDGGKWPLLSAADVPELEKEAEAPAAEEPAAVAPAATSETPQTAKDVAGLSVNPPHSKPLVGIAIGIVILVVWFFVLQNNSNIRVVELAGQSISSKPLDRARAVLQEMGLKDTIKIEETAGRVSISGYVDTEARQRELQAAFRETLPGVYTRIYSLEKIASTARSLLDDQHLLLTVSSLSEGKLKISGRLSSAEPWVRMRQTLERSVPGIGGIEDGVEIEAPRSGNFRNPDGPGTGQGTLISSKQGTLTQLEIDPENGYLITNDTIDTPESTVAIIKSKPDLPSFIRLSTGGVYFAGARLPFGGLITRIDENSLTIEEKGATRTLQTGDLVVMPKKSKPTPTSASTKP